MSELSGKLTRQSQRRSSDFVTTRTFYVAECSRCGNQPDDDGGEYALSPDGALQVAAALDWEIVGDQLLCEDCQEPPDDG